MYRFLVIFLLVGFAWGAESDAIAISRNIRARHFPFGSILDPFLDESNTVTGYTRCGDSATWTGHFLAAEALRYRVTKDPEALDNVLAALFGIRTAIDVTGYDSLARCYMPKDSPIADGMLREEVGHPLFEGKCLDVPCWWVGGTSRDQYIGVFFGLATAWEVIEDPAIRGVITDMISRMLSRLQDDAWAIKNPDGAISTVFWLRPDQKLNLLAIGAKTNSRKFGNNYFWERLFQAPTTAAPIATEVADDHNSYFKFNLDVLTFYHLVRFEGNTAFHFMYEEAYDLLRRAIDSHGNAHFNMIERAIKGPDERRDAETRMLLDEWLTRPRRDEYIDLRGVLPSCAQEDQACSPIPVPQRVRTDFLWQRSPFLLYGGGAGTIEGAGIDYILPYWMARYYGVL